MKKQLKTHQLRAFGLMVGGAFALIGVWPMLLGDGFPRIWALAITAVLVLSALAYPRILNPIYRIWMAAGKMLAWVNTRVILGTLFFTLFPFFGFLRRLCGADPMRLELQPEARSYRVPRIRRPASHLKHQF
jgi:hypothetical protein